MSLKRLLHGGILVLNAILAIGCGPSGPEVASVAGMVTLDGKPLEGALVMFTPVAGGRPAAARTDEGGCYELQYTEDRDGALLGKHVVSISTYLEGDVSLGIANVPEKVPAKYNVKSELVQTVEPGSNNFDFPLSSEGEIIKPFGKWRIVPEVWYLQCGKLGTYRRRCSSLGSGAVLAFGEDEAGEMYYSVGTPTGKGIYKFVSTGQKTASK